MTVRHVYQFGPFSLDREAGILYSGSEPTILGQRAVALLRLLLLGRADDCRHFEGVGRRDLHGCMPHSITRKRARTGEGSRRQCALSGEFESSFVARLTENQSNTCASVMALTAVAAIGASPSRRGSFEINSGPRAGQTVTMAPGAGIGPITGIISGDGKTLTAAHLAPTLEIRRFSNGDVSPEMCHRSRVLMKLNDSGDQGQGQGQGQNPNQP